MKIIMELLLLALGFGMMVKGADWFVEGSSGIADRFGVPQLVIGLTIVAMGTSAPEAAVSITAALKGNAEITIGNIVGSNILNILIILGITSAIVTLAVAKSTVRIEIPYMIFITAVLLLAGFSGSMVSRGEGALLWILFLIVAIFSHTSWGGAAYKIINQSVWLSELYNNNLLLLVGMLLMFHI